MYDFYFGVVEWGAKLVKNRDKDKSRYVATCSEVSPAFHFYPSRRPSGKGLLIIIDKKEPTKTEIKSRDKNGGELKNSELTDLAIENKYVREFQNKGCALITLSFSSTYIESKVISKVQILNHFIRSLFSTKLAPNLAILNFANHNDFSHKAGTFKPNFASDDWRQTIYSKLNKNDKLNYSTELTIFSSFNNSHQLVFFQSLTALEIFVDLQESLNKPEISFLKNKKVKITRELVETLPDLFNSQEK